MKGFVTVQAEIGNQHAGIIIAVEVQSAQLPRLVDFSMGALFVVSRCTLRGRRAEGRRLRQRFQQRLRGGTVHSPGGAGQEVEVLLVKYLASGARGVLHW